LVSGAFAASGVSVVIPVYNGVRYLAPCIESIRQQNHSPLEIIVVDDGSSDGSFDAANAMPGVSCLRQTNGGAAAARNAGIRAARGRYLAFLDADDLWTANKLALQLAVFTEQPTIQLVAGRVQEFYQDPEAPIPQRLARRSGDRAYTIGAMLIRRQDFLRVGYMNSALKFGEFMDWRSRALAAGLKELVLDAVVLRRRIHDQNTTLRATHSKADYVAAIRAHLERKRATPPENT
jgi:glycosyltransferase involved in cell wall biosynthesis